MPSLSNEYWENFTLTHVYINFISRPKLSSPPTSAFTETIPLCGVVTMSVSPAEKKTRNKFIFSIAQLILEIDR